MKRKWQTLVALFLVLVTVMAVAVPALAQDEGPVTDANSARGALAIIAPWTVPAGREFTVRVFLREDQEPFAGAGVWIVDADAAAALREALGPDGTAAQADEEGILNRYAKFLGRTGTDGRLACTIERAGRYVLVAARHGYRPGFTRIGIRQTIKALGIRAPQRARTGQPVSIGVFDRVAQEPVVAGVWAVSRDNVEALRQAAQALKDDTSLTDDEKDYEAIANLYGIYLGRTGPDGILEHTFDEAGGYLLVAIRPGYFPGFAKLVVVDVTEPSTLTPQSRLAPRPGMVTPQSRLVPGAAETLTVQVR